MREFKIYTCGKMSGISLEKQMGWRCYIESLIKEKYDGYDKIKFIHPPLYYNYEHASHHTDREILDWEMMQLHDCDIVIVDLTEYSSEVAKHGHMPHINLRNDFFP